MATGKFDDGSRFLSAMFESTNRITFNVRVDEASAEWWTSEFYEPYGLTPEGIGDRLSTSWSGEKRMAVTELDGVNKRFSIEISGQFDTANFWLHDRTLDMGGKVMNANRMFISEDMRRLGVGRAFMRDAVSLCDTIGIRKIRIEAEDIGRYAWLRCGFVPDRGSWSNMRGGILTRLATALPEIGQHRFHEVLKLVLDRDPAMARVIASLPDVVSSEIPTADGPKMTTLGRALILEQQHNWIGEFDLDDRVSRELMNEGTQ